ncbi:glycoside hydrolase family 28 protein [Zasmidium cellare ATCC 36951]|uniref:Glycoside hydrolase family 28 protein n=1 Tax=Zasmidium cellare ATCC 36951 TaxID=1080233 RepID=A0A6A6CKL3_ZASCE|nr:glycoside hydrolase family 28 protein [Zasmidium cellare ATCC 36951]KAF2167153.1 glycoside hydrolase family 28 protein [Zasmidium cellare ATCC 36951]
MAIIRTAVITALAGLASAFATSQDHYQPVPYGRAPHHYPGGPWHFQPPWSRPNVCHVHNPGNGSDAAPFIIKAFQTCGRHGKVVFDNTTYHVNSVMTITDLHNVEVDVRGTLVWSKDIDYWLSHSIPIGFQNQSSAFFFGGEQVWWHGNGYGTFDGNGQTWYEAVGSQNNYPGRPHAITFRGLNNSVIEGMRFIQSQMWTMTLEWSHNVLLQDIYVNSSWTGGGDGEARRLNQNTDGADTLWSDNITFARWVIDNGDDAISQKDNSTNILMEDLTFYRGIGIALGSIGQYPGAYTQIVNVTGRRIKTIQATWYAAYAKIWSGTNTGIPPNGGGGGLGRIENFLLEDLEMGDSQSVFQLSSCYGYFGSSPACETSEFQVSNLQIRNVTGSLSTDAVVSLQCSGAAPCQDVDIEDVNVTVPDGETPQYLCDNVDDPDGFECTGPTPIHG